VTFLQGLQYSINSVFCNVGKQLGADRIVEHMKRFGFYSRPPLETPVNERSASGLYERGKLFTPEDPNDADPGRLAFGQERLLVTPLQMAIVTATVANGGVVMRPTVVERIVDRKGKTLTRTKPDELGRAIKESTARDLVQMMKAVVAGGTGGNGALPDVTVAGKTGTAETGRAGVNTVSFLAFAPADQPKVAIAVIVEAQQSTGGETAAPIAREVLQAILGGR
jgi:peptidoglycan glycosyltransferase